MSDVNQPEFWDANYRAGRTGWDLGRPTPVFERLVREGGYSPGRMMVLGAGRGHDARLFARHGFEVIATDFSPQAVQAMQVLAEPEVPMVILQADVFELPPEYDGTCQYVLEYTCFCAIDPARRDEYMDRVARLLAPGGTLIALLFPVSGHVGGPPFGVDPLAFIQGFAKLGFRLVHREAPPDSVSSRRGVEELVILAKQPGDTAADKTTRTHG